jgi:hypothetical protein
VVVVVDAILATPPAGSQEALADLAVVHRLAGRAPAEPADLVLLGRVILGDMG